MSDNILTLHCQQRMRETAAFLRQANSYDEQPSRIDVVESHMAFVFLTDQFAYKLKKPVKNTFLDFSTVELRKQVCLSEVRLNRRLAHGVYLGIVPLLQNSGGQLLLGDCYDLDESANSDNVIDWLVKMRRLPAKLMLDNAIANATIDAAMIQRVGELLSEFYLHASPVEMNPSSYLQRLHAEVESNVHELIRPRFGLSKALVNEIAAAQTEFLAQRKQLLMRRVESGHIVDAHGDLRPEHICLESPPSIIDCLEFNRELRTLDAVSDLSFLMLECERLGAPEIGQQMRDVYSKATGDNPAEALWCFYKRHHALIRSKIAIWHLDIPDLETPQKWIDKADSYLGIVNGMLDLFAEGNSD